MAGFSLTKTWNENAVPVKDSNASPDTVNVFAIDTSGNQTQQRERNNVAAHDGAINSGSHDGGKSDSSSSKKGHAAIEMMYQQLSSQYRATFAQFNKMADQVRQDYKEFGKFVNEHEQKVKDYREELDKNAITLDDGTKIFKQGESYKTFKNGKWVDLDEDQLIEAKEKEQILFAAGKQPSTTDQEDALRAYEAGVGQAGKLKRDNLQEIERLQEKVKSGQASPEEAEELEQRLQNLKDQVDPEKEKVETYEQEFLEQKSNRTTMNAPTQEVTESRETQETVSGAEDKWVGGSLFGNLESNNTTSSAKEIDPEGSISGEGIAKNAFAQVNEGNTDQEPNPNNNDQEPDPSKTPQKPFSFG